MTSKHTPGPWEAIQGFTAGRAVIATGATKAKRNVAHVGGPDRDANARLISAAPDLLEALRDMEAYCAPYAEDFEADHPVNVAFSKARAAIVKAGAA